MGGDNKGARMASAMAVVAGRAARPCDVCARKRSRWYCAADEAYLCEGCDSSVHAANALAFRHERVRLTPNGVPMKQDRRKDVNHGDPQLPHASAPQKKKLKVRPAFNSAPSGGSASAAAFPAPPRHQFGGNGNVLREVKVELGAGNCGTTDLDPSTADDDHFTAEELTGNANLLDDDSTPMCPPSSYYPDCSSSHGETDFGHDFLVADPNDCQNNNNCNGGLVRGVVRAVTASAGEAGGGEEGEGAVVDRDEDQNEDDDGEDEDGDESYVGNEWMDLANRDLSGDDDYSIDPSALRESAHDQSVALYSHDEKPENGGGLGPPSTHVRKAFKHMAGQTAWVKMEGGYYHHQHSHSGSEHYSNLAPPQQQQQALSNPSCKIEGWAMSETELRQVPSLRLNYEDVLSSWPDRGMRWTDDGTGSQLVPDNSNSDAMGSCYDLGLVPDLSCCAGGIDGSGHLAAAMYHPGGGADDSVANAGNAREARVIRYREKRRTRLFSKKIRYEVRKLNAERRPRMKGRFVKRSPSRDS